MGNNDSKQGKSSRRIEPDIVKDLASRLGVKSEADRLSKERCFQNLGWKDFETSITETIWTCVDNLSQADPKLKHVLDLVDGTLFQDQSYAAFYISKMLNNPTKNSIEMFLQDLLKLYCTIPTPSQSSWCKVGVAASESTSTLLCARFIGTLQSISSENNVEAIENLLRKEPLVFALQRLVFGHLFKLKNLPLPELTPLLTSQLSPSPRPSILDMGDIIFLNHSLPHDMQSEWNLVFSTHIHGLSFSSLLGKLTSKGPTIVIVEDSKGHVFGGFASESWLVSPKFIGDSRCFLFQIRPNFSIYHSTGYNDHFMYLNHQQQTMPNGLGMGGQLGHFGIWVDADFGKGHCSEGCSTFYRVPTLSSDKDFTVEHIEVWAVGPPPKEDSDDETDNNKRSILDKDSGAKALLELVDRGHHSEGLRELPDE